jgi:hypothetical protein
MSLYQEEDPVLPFTPTHTGRRAKIGYLGIDGSNFNDLWPLFVGVIATVALSLASFIGDSFSELSAPVRLGLVLAPVALGYGYLRFLVHGRPPHFRTDLWLTCRSLRFDLAERG